MFDRNKGRDFLSASKARKLPQLEKLEDRAVPAVIGGVVYQDLNFNGLFESGEQGISNTTVSLTDASNHVLATTTTNSAGQYQFAATNVNTSVPASSAYAINFDLAKTDLNRSGALPQFNPALGTLTSVEILARGSTTTNAAIENMDAEASTLKAEINADLSFTVGGTVLRATPSTTQTANVAGFDGTADLKGASSNTFGPILLQGSFTQATLTDPSQMAAFVGAGTVNVQQVAKATSCSCGPGNLLAMVKTQAEGGVQVVYHYTPSNVIGPGQYVVVETQPPVFNDGLDTGTNVTAIPNSDHTDTITVTINTSNDQSLNNNFGETKTPPPDKLIPPPPPPTGDLPSKDLFIFYL